MSLNRFSFLAFVYLLIDFLGHFLSQFSQFSECITIMLSHFIQVIIYNFHEEIATEISCVFLKFFSSCAFAFQFCNCRHLSGALNGINKTIISQTLSRN